MRMYPELDIPAINIAVLQEGGIVEGDFGRGFHKHHIIMRTLKLLLAAGLLFRATGAARGIEVARTTCEMTERPLCVSVERPRFGWQLMGGAGTRQSAYEIEVYTMKSGVKQTVWGSGKVTSDRSQFVPYGGLKLEEARYFWRVRAWDEGGRASGWSEEAEFRMAPDASFLDAKWIGAITREASHFPLGRSYASGTFKKPEVKAVWDRVDSLAWRSICLRREFSVAGRPIEATAYVCGLGHYELTINGEKVGDGMFTPLWSDYDKTVYYDTYDVTDMVRSGGNAVGVLLGNGFYNVVGGNRYSKLKIGFGPETLFFKMVIRYADGRSETVSSDKSWKYTLSPVTFNTIYGGEDYDARLEQDGWDEAGFDDGQWKNVVVQERPKGVLRPCPAPPVKVMRRHGVKSRHELTVEEARQATKVTKRTVEAGTVVLDMGQNLSGFPEITVSGRRGDRVTLVVAENVADSCGAANQRQTGRPHYYTYTLKGAGEETWHPRFSYYGFRYIQVEGAVLVGMRNPGRLPVIKRIESCFVHNSAADVGHFECSNPILTRAHELIRCAVRSNMQAVLTDCPHREKLGWLEQDYLNGPGLLYNYDLTTYFPKLMQDIADAQRTDGMVPSIAPQFVVFEGPGMDAFAESPEWGSALVVLPFMYYETYGDDSLIRHYYRRMRAYVDYLSGRSDGRLVDFGLGDWYDYGDFRSGFSRNTPVGLVASAHYYMDILYVARAARMVGNDYDAAYYARLCEEVKSAFNRKYFDTERGSYGTGSQCSNALPLFLDMVPEGERGRVLESLVEDIRRHGTRLTTGDVGNRYLFQVLAREGLDDLMYAMHNHEEVPGYGFQLKFGATTLTEQWDPRQGSSWNHFMMGQIDEWFYKSLAGIRPEEDGLGYQHIIVRPRVPGDLKWVKSSIDTLYGKVAVEWRREGETFSLDVSIPANCTAEVYLPGDSTAQRVGSGNHTFTKNLQ